MKLTMIPSLNELKQMTTQALSRHRLDKIDYNVYGPELVKLTFVFANGGRSPPKGTYMNGEPD